MNASAASISNLLTSLASSDSFATRFALDADPQLHVEGAGSLTLPVTVHMAHRLCAIARPAMHGYKDQTLLDPKVRDTWEIPASQIRFDSPTWQATLKSALERIRHDLQLPVGCKIGAQLHNMLVYAPGQFFMPHQDSEKADGMLGSLVVTLPSQFTGGEFIVSHQGQTLRSRSSASKLGLMAFYADCCHEVRPVKQGYRVVLTYNLIVQDSVRDISVAEQTVTALCRAVHKFWHPPVQQQHESHPNRLVYLLDHQYTQHSLSWSQLKGADAIRCEALRQAAQQLDAEVFLTLADVHESWTAFGDDDYDNHWHHEQDDDEDAPSSEPDPVELIERNILLQHWIAIDADDAVSDEVSIDDEELCFTRNTADYTPYESQYEGYMGNYGNTLDRWYYRAALVMWPRTRRFTIRARQSPSWAIEQIAERIAAGDQAQAQEWAHELLPFWGQGHSAAPECLRNTLSVVVGIDDAHIAAMLLAPSKLEQFRADMAPLLLSLAKRYGPAWCGQHINQKKRRLTDEYQLQWLEQNLPALIRALLETQDVNGPVLVRMLLQERWQWLKEYIEGHNTYAGQNVYRPPLMPLGQALLALTQSAEASGLHGLRQQVVEKLVASLPLQTSLDVLHQATVCLTRAHWLASVHEHCVSVLAERLAQPERAADDWSIRIEDLGNHERDRILTAFLKSASQRRLEWKLAEEGRKQVKNIVARQQLPVQLQTVRTGSPYTLILEKTEALFTREIKARRLWTENLTWLQQVAGQFSSLTAT